MCHFKCSYTVCLIWQRQLYRLKVYFLTSSTVCVYVESEDHTLWLTELLWVWPSCHFITFSVEPNSHWLLQFCPERDNGTFWAQIWNSLGKRLIPSLMCAMHTFNISEKNDFSWTAFFARNQIFHTSRNNFFSCAHNVPF